MKNSNLFIRKLLYNKKFTVPFSICFAIVLWLIITVDENPVRERTISGITVNVNADETVLSELGLDVVDGGYGQKVDVVVSGPNYIVSSITESDILVKPDLNDISAAGTYDLKLLAVSNSSATGYTILSVNPATISVSFDFTDTRTFTVGASAEGAVAADGLVAESAVVSESKYSTITVKGVRSAIEKIDRVEAVASVKDTLDTTSSFDADIVLFDAAGKKLDASKYTLEFDTVKITVPISRKKTVKLETAFKNMPDYYKPNPLDCTLQHKSVTIIGPPETVDKIEKLQLSEIDFNTITPQTATFNTTVQLPDGVKLVDNIETVEVKISLRGYSEKTVRVSDFVFQNKASGLTATGSSVQNVKICGPSSVIRRLTADDVYALADLSGKQAGDYTVNVTVRSDKYPEIWQVGEYTAAIKIK